MRNIFLVLLLLVFLVGNTEVGRVSAETDWQCPAGLEGQTLRIFSWANYVAETTIPDFENACGATIEYFEYSSSDDMLNVMETGSAEYDLVIAAGGMARTMIEMDLVQALDYGLLPNLEKVTLDPVSGFLQMRLDYYMMYQGSTIGVAYDVNAVDEPITTWEGFFAYEGRVAWMDDARFMLGIVGNILGNFVATFDEGEIAAEADYLLTVPKNDVFAIASNTQSDLLLQGEVDAIIDSSRNVVTMMRDCACEDFAFVIPSDGLLATYDVMVIPTNSEHVPLAHAFIDYILEPQVNADLSSALGSSAVVMESLPLVDEEIYTNGISYLSFETLMGFLDDFQDMEDMEGMEHIGETMDLYTSTWSDIKAELASR